MPFCLPLRSRSLPLHCCSGILVSFRCCHHFHVSHCQRYLDVLPTSFFVLHAWPKFVPILWAATRGSANSKPMRRRNVRRDRLQLRHPASDLISTFRAQRKEYQHRQRRRVGFSLMVREVGEHLLQETGKRLGGVKGKASAFNFPVCCPCSENRPWF